MTKRLNVSVPDDVYVKMQEWKDTLNFSGIFKKAMSEAIEKKEKYKDFKQKTKEAINMDTVIERLKKEKSESHKDAFDEGKKDGYEYAKSATYDEFQYVLQYETLRNRILKFDNRGYPHPPEDEVFGDYFAERIEQHMANNLSTWDNMGDLPDEYFVEWEAGFIEGIKDFWEEVKDKI